MLDERNTWSTARQGVVKCTPFIQHLVTSHFYTQSSSMLLSSFCCSTCCLSIIFYLRKTRFVKNTSICYNFVIICHLLMSTVSKFFSSVSTSPAVIHFFFMYNVFETWQRKGPVIRVSALSFVFFTIICAIQCYISLSTRFLIYTLAFQKMRNRARSRSTSIRQIDLDVNRTYRNHIMFRERYGVKWVVVMLGRMSQERERAKKV